VTEEEIFDILSPEQITTRSSMQARLRELIELVKLRDEKDNITGVLFRAMF
jgi:serine/threonine protein phosphatase PrpC